MKSDSDERVIYDPRTNTIARATPVFVGAPQYLPTHSSDLGAYEIRGEGTDREVTGECAAGDGPVTPGSPFVIRYSLSHAPGGIFHSRCAPTDVGWYSLEDEGEE